MNRFKAVVKDVLFFAVIMALTIVIAGFINDLFEWTFSC